MQGQSPAEEPQRGESFPHHPGQPGLRALHSGADLGDVGHDVVAGVEPRHLALGAASGTQSVRRPIAALHVARTLYWYTATPTVSGLDEMSPWRLIPAEGCLLRGRPGRGPSHRQRAQPRPGREAFAGVRGCAVRGCAAGGRRGCAGDAGSGSGLVVPPPLSPAGAHPGRAQTAAPHLCRGTCTTSSTRSGRSRSQVTEGWRSCGVEGLDLGQPVLGGEEEHRVGAGEALDLGDRAVRQERTSTTRSGCSVRSQVTQGLRSCGAKIDDGAEKKTHAERHRRERLQGRLHL